MSFNVCVIGAGPSGLVTIKELINAGIRVRCFESSNALGGAFNSTITTGQSYNSLKLTVSNYFMAYSDFMPSDDEPRRFWTAEEYKKYLENYVESNKIRKYICTGHRVISAKVENEKVKVHVSNKRAEFTEEYDYLAVCTGSNAIPKVPRYKDIELFEGSIIHSRSYLCAEKYRNKKVVCIGLGESGADIVHEISQVTDCTVLVRDFPNVIPRWINNHTSDAYTTIFFYSMRAIGINLFMRFKAWYLLNFVKNLTKEEKLIQKWTLKRKKFLGKFLTKNDIFIRDIVEEKVRLVKDTISFFTQNGVVTENGEAISADVVIFNTGYKTDFRNFSFGKDFENPRKLFKNMISPKYGKLISLIGWARPSQGGLPACSEMQARYLALLISEKKRLPPVKEQEKTIQKDKRHNENVFDYSKELTSLVNYYDFMTSMSLLIGCSPRLIYWNDFELSKKLVFGSHISACYRLNDPQTRQKSINTIKSLTIAYSSRRIFTILLFILIFNPVTKIKKTFLN